MKRTKINNIVCVSDLHCGSKLGLIPPSGIKLDDGGEYKPSPIQRKMWKLWRHFWDKWVPTVTKGEEYVVVVNGDLVDGVHHQTTTTVSNNMVDQRVIAEKVLADIAFNTNCTGIYVIRGTEAHGGLSGTDEEQVARSVRAIPNRDGQFARWDLWIRCGTGLVHFLHHIGTTGSAAYESTAVHKELVEAYCEAGRWGNRPPDVIVRSHRHRSFETRIPTSKGYGIACVTAGWQAKTPFAFRIPGGRQSQPQFGGILIRQGDDDLFTRAQVWSLDRPVAE